jgi:hypothetical protein
MKTYNLKDHFNTQMWKGGGVETVSGAGSTLRYTERLRPELSKLVATLGIKRLLDAPCGDFNWLQYVDLDDIEYTGLDIIDDVISMNQQRYAASNRIFLSADITKDPLPPADLILCRDLLLHLPYQNIADLFENIISSEFSFILITSYVNNSNRDLDIPGKARALNLSKEPLNFEISSDHVQLPDWIPGFRERYLVLFGRYDFVQSARRCIPRLRDTASHD